MKEIWKDIKGYEGIYQVSNLGNLKSLSRLCDVGNGVYRKKEKIIYKFSLKNGYPQFNLCKNNTHKNVYIHRLVGEYFLSNLSNFPTINHKDGIKTNNNINNLEWCTYLYNNKHAINYKLRKLKPLLQYDLQGNFIKEWFCVSKCSKELGIHISNICNCIKGKRKTAGGFKWKYK
jgi:hypothetical protein